MSLSKLSLNKNIIISGVATGLLLGSSLLTSYILKKKNDSENQPVKKGNSNVLRVSPDLICMFSLYNMSGLGISLLFNNYNTLGTIMFISDSLLGSAFFGYKLIENNHSMIKNYSKSPKKRKYYLFNVAHYGLAVFLRTTFLVSLGSSIISNYKSKNVRELPILSATLSH